MIHIEEGYQDKFALTSRSTFNRGTKDFINQGFSPIVQVQTHRAQKSRSQNRVGGGEMFRQSVEGRENRLQMFSKNERNNGEKKLPSIPIAMVTGESNRLSTGRRLNASAVTVDEMKKMLESSPKKTGVELLQNQNFVKNFLIEEDYDNVGPKQARDEDREHVRTLDRWRLEVQRKAMMSSMDKKSEMRELYRQRKEMENNHIPNVNNDALNKILIDTDEDFNEAHNIGIQGGFRRKGTGFDFTEEKIVKGIEGAMIDSNHGLLTSLIERKVESELKPEDVQRMTVQQVRLQIKLIAETVIMKYRAFQKNVSDTFVQSQVERILKKIKAKPSMADTMNNGPRGLEDVFEKQLDRAIIDYRMKEASLIRDYEQTMIDIQGLGTRLTNLNHENFQLKRDIAIAQDQIQQVNKVYKALEAKYEEQCPPSASSDGKRKGKIMSEDTNIAVDIARLTKARHEKKRQEAILNERIKGFQERLTPIIKETETVEAELKVARGSKAYYKVQLKDLYYQILKDDRYLIQNQSESSCTWIIKSLWTIGEEVKAQDFPVFMDRHCVKFMLDYAKAQAELEKFCKQHGLSMLMNLEEFKSLNLTSQHAGRETSEKHVSVVQSDLTPKLDMRPKTKDFLLEDFKNRMQSMKKENIKARRMINMVQYNAKGRQVISKWEDINPFITNEQLMNHIQGFPIEASSPSPSSRVDKLKFTPKLDFSSIDVNPAETAQKMLANIENMKKNELNRIIKESVMVQLDERIMTTLSKTFRFMLGKTEGIEAYRRFLKEKKTFEDKNMKSEQTHKKSQSQPRFQAEQVLVSMIGPQGDKLGDDYKDDSKSQSPSRKTPLSRSGTTSILPLKITSSPIPSERNSKIQFNGSASSRTLRLTNSMLLK